MRCSAETAARRGAAGRLRRLSRLAGLAAGLAAACGGPALAQGIDFTQGGPITITARDGLEWLRAQHEVIARGDARATRQDATVTADRLIAWYRKKAATTAQSGTAQSGTAMAGAASPAAPAADTLPGSGDTSGNEIYRIEAEGHVHIFTPTERAQCDRAVYDLDQAVLVMTGHDLRLTTPNEVLTARDDMEYWSARHMAVARGDAVVVTRDARRISADVLVAYTEPSPAAPAGAAAAGAAPSKTAPSAAAPAATAPAGAGTTAADAGKLKKVEAFGHVTLRTPTDIVTGDRGIYIPATGMARIVGNVRITRGQNQLAGQVATVDLRTGVAQLQAEGQARVQGLIMPETAPQAAAPAPAGTKP